MEDDNSSIGRRIARARKRRNLTQTGLAEAAHLSRSLLKQVESGHKAATPTTVAAVARALQVEVSELYGQPYRGETFRTDRVHAAIPVIRQALAYVDVPPALETMPRSLDELAAEIRRLKKLQGDAQHIELGAALPSVIDELAVHAYGEATGRAWTLLNRAYSIANSLARRLGYDDLAQVAIDRCAYAAARADDLELPRLVTLSRALLMLSAGAYDGASALLDTAIRSADAGTPESVTVLAALHLRAAVTSARAGKSGDAWEHHGIAADLVERRGDAPDFYELQVNADNVRIHHVAVAIELQEYDQAVREGAGLMPSESLMAERHAHHEIDMSRAWLWTGRPDKALSAVLAAERIAPQMAHYHPMARETTTRLFDSRRRAPEPLRGLANRMGIT